MNNVSDVTMTGETTGNQFGYSVSSAGDVNADGYSDVIAGANGYSSNTGRSYIFLGGSSMNNTADVVMTGEVANNIFGVSVSSAGDVNGDGFGDVITGAYGFNSNSGRAYIFYGGASMNSAADVTMMGEAMFNYFGNSVSKAGDVNGDGYSDVIIGAFGNTSFTGKAYVYFGGALMDTIADVSMAGETTNSSFGTSVASAGDINDDGYSDIIVGAYGYGSNMGRAYFYDYFMKNEIIPQITMKGEVAGNTFGYSVSSAGDVNGDGYSDVIVGAFSYNLNSGRAYIYFGGISMDNIADVTMTGATTNNFGYSVASAGDVNGDGYSDVIIGAYGYSSSTGRAYIYFGGTSMDNVADITMTGETTNNYFGYSVSSAGDVNGDGYSDVIVGAYGYSSIAGRAYIYYGGASMDNIADAILTGPNNSWFGFSVSTAGDVNGDGYSDVIVGAQSYNSGTGRAYIYLGSTLMDNGADVTMTGEITNDYFGYSVSSAGDVNGDGYSDVIVGAYNYNLGAGRVYIYFGVASMDNIADVIITGAASNTNLGTSVSCAGDMNGDGYSDVIVASISFNGVRGMALIFFGGVSMNTIADVNMTGEAVNNYFGRSVSSAGDINGDGYSDVIAGADGFNSYTGRAYIYTGSAISVKPILIHAKDVPNDQGGFVDLKWARSSSDVNGNDIITSYLVERSLPPSGGNFAWVNIAGIPATKNSFYSFLAPTPYDSSLNSSGTFFFRITALTSSPSQYWRSAILSGRSLDNISPPVVSPFNAFKETVNVRLTWKKSAAPDLLNYILFRSTSPSIDPYTELPFATLTDSTYLDVSPLSGLYYYFIVAQDIHNNYSPVAVVQSPVTPKVLFLFGAIQGMYDPGSNVMIYDTVTVYLRNATSPFAKIDSSRKQLYGPGTGQQFSFYNVQNNIPYYVVVKHRNALETWSADPVTFTGDNASIAFSVNSIYAYGNNEIQVDNNPYNVFAFYSGDVNQDGFINLSDIILISNNASNFVNGYVNTDLTGDNVTNLSDILIAYTNSQGFVSIKRP
ncbi:MAG: FG-GAP-like repeat-containing protein [Ignavibacteria bacterium]